jgi:uncharacterized delta-60 repeat protein
MTARELLCSLLIMPGLAHAQWLDPDFGTGGQVEEPFSFDGADYATSAVLQPDGKIVVAGSIEVGAGERDHFVARFNANGTLDSGFGSGGGIAVDVQAQDQANGIALQADGGIVVVGTSASPGTDKVVMRFTTNGVLDTTFNGSGILVIDDSFAEDQLYGVAIQPDQKIVVVGQGFNGSKDTFYIARLNSDGSFDAGFSGGQIEHTISGDNCHANAVTVMADGRIVSVGASYTDANTGNDAAVVRYLADGSLDTGFDGDGIVVLPAMPGTETAYAVHVRAGDDVLVGATVEVGIGEFYVAVAHVLETGDPDVGWGISGWVLLHAGINGTRATAVSTDLDGHVLVAGTLETETTGTQTYLARLMGGSGVLDPGFGSGGELMQGSSIDPGSASAMVVQPDNKVVLAGGHGVSAGSNVRLIRYLHDLATSISTPAASSFVVHEAQGRLGFSLPDAGPWVCSLVDMQGRTCRSATAKGVLGSPQTMDLAALPTGGYTLLLQQGGRVMAARFIHDLQ